MTSFGDLLGPPPVLLDIDEEPELQLHKGRPAAEVAADFPTSSLAWATLAEGALEAEQAVTAYAYARTGYHRGLDQLRRQGWRGFGPCRSRTRTTGASYVPSPRWRRPRSRSARRTSTSAAWTC